MGWAGDKERRGGPHAIRPPPGARGRQSREGWPTEPPAAAAAAAAARGSLLPHSFLDLEPPSLLRRWESMREYRSGPK